jgi:hypothetical protein
LNLVAGLEVTAPSAPDCCCPGRSETGIGRWEEFAFLGGDQFLGLAQGGLRRLQIGIGNQRLLNQGIERVRREQPPPLTRNIASVDEMLALSALDTGSGCGPWRQRLRRVARHFRRRRMLEIRTHAQPEKRMVAAAQTGIFKNQFWVISSCGY